MTVVVLGILGKGAERAYFGEPVLFSSTLIHPDGIVDVLPTNALVLMEHSPLLLQPLEELGVCTTSILLPQVDQAITLVVVQCLIGHVVVVWRPTQHERPIGMCADRYGITLLDMEV